MATLNETASRQLLESHPDGILVVDHVGRVCFANPAAEGLLGLGAGELLGENLGSPAVEGEVVEVSLLRETPGGAHKITLEIRVASIQWEGRPAWLEALRDVTRQRQREHEALENVHHRDRFLAILSHELRNPLSALAEVPRLLLGDADPAQVRRAREVLERQTRTLGRLLDDLLDVARISQHKVVLHAEPVDFPALVTDCADSIRSRAEARDVALQVQLPADPVVVSGDAVRLQQVVANLLTNAVKYTDRAGRVHVAVRLLDDLEDLPLPPHLLRPAPVPMGTGSPLGCRWVELAVTDTGVGIPEGMLGRIFEPFFQVRGSLDHAEGGLGIGLALVRRLALLHGGWVTASSPGLGQGSTFRLYLPVGASGSGDTAWEVHEPDGQPLVVVLVEDQTDVREMLAELLRLDGHIVHLAADSQEALRQIAEARPAVALVDIGLPGVDGNEVARTAHQTVGDATTFVALTGYGHLPGSPQVIDPVFAHHLVKPVHYNALARLLARLRRSSATTL